ncbi:hypothetical protein BWI97_07185 [Siphonobacter sp. BAB-5405]|uniref:hypothetical protein n=1 Tax=Siphonobacter sp. BAB-5405 TaxID=1864825 RepID=UPI000C7F88C9|nr:hypothetical protein [Siphonobacter sp. BAB-5405]PMD97406.1 hypothetical protein BWI97_07185 [Siphonobacter sp. BAB-5405]
MKRFHIEYSWYELPSCWKEVPASQVLPILLAVYSNGRTATGRLKVLSYINPVPPKTFKKLVAWQINELCRLIDWTFETPIDEQPFESFSHQGVTYYLPGPALQSVTFNEFVTALTYLYQFYYVPEERPENLTNLIATLCRPGVTGLTPLSVGYQGDLREPFNEHTIKARAKVFLNLEAGIAAAVLQYFVSNFRWLFETYPVFESSGSGSSQDPDAEPHEFAWLDQLLTIRDLAFQVAETKLLGTVQQVEASNITLVFETLEHIKEMQDTAPKHSPEETYE